MSISPTTRKAIQKAASHSSLEAIGWGLAFPDFARTVPGLNFKVGKEDDRGLALESQWWTRMGAQSLTAGGGASNTAKTDEETSMMRDLRMRDLVSATNKGLVPPVIFNSTTVETGQRTMIASFATNLDATSSNASTEIVEYERISRPIDFFGFYEPLFHNPRDVNPRVSTAVRLSSSFAYVTPVARPVLPTDRLASNLTPLLKRRANYHLCDGGYSENTGLVGTVRVITDLINQHIKEGTAPPFDRILFLSIESFPDNLVETEDDVTGLSSGCIGPLSAIFASRVASQAERAELELELLIRSEDQSFARKSDGEIMAVFDIDSYENYRSNAEQLVSRIESSNLADDEKEELAGFLTPISKTKLRPDDRESMTTKIPLRQANAIKAKADKFIQREGMFRESFSKAFSDDDQSLVNTFVVQSRAMAQLDVPSDDHKVASANSVFNLSIACIQFRFDPRSGAVMRSGEEGIKKDLKDTKVPNPPLSWMLSPYDKYRIDLAWENQLQRLKGNVATAAPSQEENDERLMPPEMLQRILKFDKEVK